MNQWIPEETVCEETNLVAEECMAGNGYSRRWTSAEPVDGLWAVVTIGFYCNDRRGAYGSDDPDVVGMDSVDAQERYSIGQHIEFARCKDPQAMGESGDWFAYRDTDSWFNRAEKFTDEQIKALMENYKTEWIDWDGNEAGDDLDTLAVLAEPVDPEDWDKQILTEELKAVVDDIVVKRDRYGFKPVEEIRGGMRIRLASGDLLYAEVLSNPEAYRDTAVEVFSASPAIPPMEGHTVVTTVVENMIAGFVFPPGHLIAIEEAA